MRSPPDKTGGGFFADFLQTFCRLFRVCKAPQSFVKVRYFLIEKKQKTRMNT